MPLGPARLDELALAYVARFATSRARLRDYLGRKVRERGWADEDRPPDFEAIAERMAGLGFIDDRAFAEAKGASLTRRGFGGWRVRQALGAAGIAEADGASAIETADQAAWSAALRFAERKRIGPYALARGDPRQQERALAAMLRAGHRHALARRLVTAAPGEIPDDPEM